MKIRCHHLSHGIQNAVFFWEESYIEMDKFGNKAPRKRKQFKALAVGDDFDIPDEVGHEILSRYKENLRVIHYGDAEPQAVEKMAQAPRNVMIKDERNK